MDPFALYKKMTTMQKRAFTVAELAIAGLPLLAAAGYGGYKTVQHARNSQGALARGAAGAGIGAAAGGTVGAAAPALAALLSRGKAKPGLLRSMRNGAATLGAYGTAGGGLAGIWSAPRNDK